MSGTMHGLLPYNWELAGEPMYLDEDLDSYLVAAADDDLRLFIGGSLRMQLVAGSTVSYNNLQLLDNLGVLFGTSPYCRLEFDTAQTVDALLLGVDATSQMFVICDLADIDTDIGLSSYGHPALVLVSSDLAESLAIYQTGSFSVYETSPGTKHVFQISSSECFRADGSELKISSGIFLTLGNAAAAETPTATHTLRVKDSGGTEYKLLCVAA